MNKWTEQMSSLALAVRYTCSIIILTNDDDNFEMKMVVQKNGGYFKGSFYLLILCASASPAIYFLTAGPKTQT